MNKIETLAAAHRAANGVLRDWVHVVLVRKIHPEDLASLARREPSAEVLFIAVTGRGSAAFYALEPRQRLALETFYAVLKLADALIPPAPRTSAPTVGHMAERITGGDDDITPGMDDRETLR